MAKNISPEVMETILTKIMEKVADTFQNAIGQLVAVVISNMDSKMSVIASRLDSIEAQMNQMKNPDVATGIAAPTAAIEDATRAIMALEQEREEIRVRSRNIVVSGLLPVAGSSDIELLEQVCEQHLTVKPHFIRARRLGKDKDNPSAKLCVTLESSDAAEDLIASSSMLRHSTIPSIRNIFLNRDLTRKQADIAYKKRCELKIKRNQSSSHPNSLNPDAVPFPSE
jgi:hypothetical protein